MPGFLEQLKALLGQASAPPQDMSGIDQERPWDSPVLRPSPAPSPSPSPSPTPTPIPEQPTDEAMALAQEILRQKEVAKRILPEGTWNK